MNASPIDLLERAGTVLATLSQDFVFLGGATVVLHLDDSNSPGLRITKDVDCVVEAATLVEFAALEEELRTQGFEQRTQETGPICRWYHGDLILDILPVQAEILGFSNRWLSQGAQTAIPAKLPSGRLIYTFDLIHLVATKIEAFEDRGRRDPMMSRDLEDIVMLFDGVSQFPDELRGKLPVHQFVRAWLKKQVEDPDFLDLVAGHLPPSSGGYGRAELLLDRLRHEFEY